MTTPYTLTPWRRVDGFVWVRDWRRDGDPHLLLAASVSTLPGAAYWTIRLHTETGVVWTDRILRRRGALARAKRRVDLLLLDRWPNLPRPAADAGKGGT
jgi:hypothetical protein